MTAARRKHRPRPTALDDAVKVFTGHSPRALMSEAVWRLEGAQHVRDAVAKADTPIGGLLTALGRAVVANKAATVAGLRGAKRRGYVLGAQAGLFEELSKFVLGAGLFEELSKFVLGGTEVNPRQEPTPAKRRK